MTSLRPLADFRIAPPSTWAAIPGVPDGGDWPWAVAARLCDAPEVQEELAQRLVKSHPDVIGGTRHMLVAVWVPVREIADVAGLLTVDWMLPDKQNRLTREFYREQSGTIRRKGVEVYQRNEADIDLPAGPTLRTRERIGRPAGGAFSRRQIVQENVIFTVFPPDCSDALQLAFSTPALDLAEAMVTDADAAVHTLEIILEEPQ